MTPSTIRLPCLVLLCATFALASLPAHADSPTRKAAEFASHTGNILYLVAGAALPLATDGENGKNHALRVVDAAGTATAITEGLKLITREKRPNSNEHDSFPSGHATASFAVATVQSALHPRQSWLWYTGATLVSLSRIRIEAHHPQDVLVGALIGFGVGRLEVSQPHGLVLQPWIHEDKPGVMIEVSGSL